MDTPSNPESFYINLKDKLYDTASWPSEYLYKFIIKSNPSKVNKIESAIEIQIKPVNKIENEPTFVPNTNGTKIKIKIKKLAANKKLVLEKNANFRSLIIKL